MQLSGPGEDDPDGREEAGADYRYCALSGGHRTGDAGIELWDSDSLRSGTPHRARDEGPEPRRYGSLLSVGGGLTQVKSTV